MELTKIKGVNEKRQADFNKLGITDTEGLIRHFPRAYLDLRRIELLKNCYHNDIVLTVGKVGSIPQNFTSARRTKYVKVYCFQQGEPFTAIWFNQPYVLSKLKPDTEYLFYGRVRNEYGSVSMVNPSFEPVDANYRLKGIIPQYSLKGNLTQKTVRDSIKTALRLTPPKSVIPIELQRKYELSDLTDAYAKVHNPESFNEKSSASDRIAVEEYFTLISAFKLIKGSSEQVRLRRYNCTDKQLLEFIYRFPFEFTDGQKKAVNEIFADMTGQRVMNRLLQGDVGSGKTAVGLSAMFMAVKSGYQAVMLAPTEVLAEQNYVIINKYFYDYNVELLTGSTPAKEKKDIKERLKNGQINILVGTHAVIQPDVVFKSLAFCVCDEQHRFGVAQRSNLSDKGIMPDTLVMSATPIPRTLSLIFYGDLDISTISDKPAERAEIQTNIVPHRKYDDMLKFIGNQIKEGRQAYLVCPKIEEDEEGSVMSVTEVFEEVKSKLPFVKFALLHGKMKDKEKNAVMRDFKNKLYDCLVSTTVIEVGIDVPNASVMVIYNAERFGLSQLHQLRGRVGRSNLKSYCFLLSDSTGEVAVERLKIMRNNSDGFKIAEYDYEMRGSGDFLGSRQSGKFISDLGNLNYSTSAIFLAKKLSDETFMSGKVSEELKSAAVKKYEKLKDVTLN